MPRAPVPSLAQCGAMASQFNPLEVLPISETYFEDVIARAGAAGNLRVQDSGPGRGKGIYATADFAEGDVIFRERPLVRGGWADRAMAWQGAVAGVNTKLLG